MPLNTSRRAFAALLCAIPTIAIRAAPAPEPVATLTVSPGPGAAHAFGRTDASALRPLLTEVAGWLIESEPQRVEFVLATEHLVSTLESFRINVVSIGPDRPFTVEILADRGRAMLEAAAGGGRAEMGESAWPSGARSELDQSSAGLRFQDSRTAAERTHAAVELSPADEEFHGKLPRRLIFSLSVDINALRRARPAACDFPEGRIGRLLEAAGLANARRASLSLDMVESTNVPTRDPSVPLLPSQRNQPQEPYDGAPLLVGSFSYESRAEKPGIVHTIPFTTRHWPLRQLGEPPATGLVAVVKPQLAAWIVRTALLYRGWLAPDEGERFRLAYGEWSRNRARSLRRIEESVAPLAVVQFRRDAGVGGGAFAGVTCSFGLGESDPAAVQAAIAHCLDRFDDGATADSKQAAATIRIGPPRAPFAAAAWRVSTKPGPNRAVFGLVPGDHRDGARRFLDPEAP